MTWEILCIFIMMVGEMQRRLEQCIDFAKKRTQFGAPIASNQYIQSKIVDQKIGVDTSRKHLYDTAERVARKRSVVTEIAIAKLVTSEANLASALSAVQIFGGRGLHARGRPGEGAPSRRRGADILGHERDAAHPDRVDARPDQAGLEVILRGDR